MNSCEHRHVRKSIGLGADGKTYCVDCGIERPPFSFLDLMADRTGAATVDLTQEPEFAFTPSPECVAEIERLEIARAQALHRCRDILVGDSPTKTSGASGT